VHTQIALFSATLPAPIRRLADRYLSEPHEITINPSRVTVAETEQRLVRVREEDKMEALVRLLEVEDVRSALIFARTKARAQDLADDLVRRGYPAEALHGDLSQARRESVLGRFRHSTITLLVATDVAARGLDVEGITHVFNYDVPGDAEDYVHRIGRTGRAGRKGVAITFLTSRERRRLGEIEAYTRQPLVEYRIPGPQEVLARRDEIFSKRLQETLTQGLEPRQLELVQRLLLSGMDPVELAAAAVQMARGTEGQINTTEIAPVVPEKRSERWAKKETKQYNTETRPASKTKRGTQPVEPFRPAAREQRNGEPQRAPKGRHLQEAGMIRLRMNLGNSHGLRPSDVVGAIAGEVGIPGKAIGDIDIHRDHTYVHVSEKHARQVLRESSGRYMVRGRPVILTLAS
jgi:ATP-dependent RNA helicase DeaD